MHCGMLKSEVWADESVSTGVDKGCLVFENNCASAKNADASVLTDAKWSGPKEGETEKEFKKRIEGETEAEKKKREGPPDNMCQDSIKIPSITITAPVKIQSGTS